MSQKENKINNQITIRLTTYEVKKIKELQLQGLTVRQILQYSNCPCDKCKNSFITVFNDLGDEVLVPRGLLKIK